MATQRRTSGLAQAAMGRGGGGGGAAGIAQTLQQFMQTFGQAMNKMTTGIQQAHAQQAQESQQQMKNVANVAEQAYNHAQRQAEMQHQEARQDAATENARGYQLKLADYQDALQRNVEKDAKEVALLLNQQNQAQTRVVQDHEKNVATVKDSVNQGLKWIYGMDANNSWDQLGPDGLKLRETMLSLAHTSKGLSEDYDNSPYMDKFLALKGQADKDIIAGKTDYQSLVDTRPPQLMVPVPESMTHAKDLNLPVFSKDEIAQWEARNGYPKGGLWAMKTDDPKTLLVNPVGFSALMAAKQEDSMAALLSSAASKRDFILGRVKEARTWKDYIDKQEELQVSLRNTFRDLVPDVVSKTFQPAPVQAALGGVGTAPSAPDAESLLYSMYAAMLKDPDVVDKVRGLSAPVGDPKRWVPGDHPELADPGEKAARAGADSPVMWKIKAAEAALTDYLESGHNDGELRSTISRWMGGLSEAQVYQIGLRDETAAKIGALKRMGPGAKIGGFFGGVTGGPAALEARKALYDAESQVIAKMNSINRDRVHVPIDTSPIMHSFRDNNHAYEALTDGHAMSVLSTMSPTDLKAASAAGALPQGLNEGEDKLFRVPVSTTQGLVMLNSRPGARTAIKDYARGGPTPEEEHVFKSPEYNRVQAYYQHVAENGFESGGVKAPPGAPSLPVQKPYQALVAKLHADRAKSVMPQEAAPQPQQAPAATNAPAPPSVPPAAGPSVGGMGEQQAPMGEPGELAPQPQMGPTPEGGQ